MTGWAATNTLREHATRNGICMICGSGVLNGEHIADYPCAIALVETALDAAEPLTGWDFAATQWIDGLTHDGHELRAIHAEDIEKLKQQVAALAAALRAVRAFPDGEATVGRSPSREGTA